MGTLRHRQAKKAKTTVEEQTTSHPNRHSHPAEELQEMLGNQAFGHLIQSQSSTGQPTENSANFLTQQLTPMNHSLIQRQPLFRGLSQELTAKKLGYPVQAKLVVNQPGDRSEQEADRVAAQAVQQMNHPVSTGSEGSLRQNVLPSPSPATGGMAVPPQLESAIAQEKGRGQPLSEEIRQPLEQTFGTDFSGVRVHTNDRSDELNRSLQACAFTTGQDIFFKQDTYQPRSHQGQKLLNHELTHVIQQTSTNTLQTKIQRTKADGTTANLSSLEALDIKKFHDRTKLHHFNIARGEYLETIERWLKAVQKATTWEDQQNALFQVTEACEIFLEDNFEKKVKPGAKEEDWRRNQIIRQQVAATQKQARDLLDPESLASQSPTSQSTGATEKTSIIRGRVKEGIEGAVESTDVISSTAGSFDDIHDSKLGDKVKSDDLDVATNIVGSIVNTRGAWKDLRSQESGIKDKINATGSLVSSVGQAGHSVGKAVKSVGGKISGDDFKVGNAFGEIGGTIGDSTAAFAGLISTTTEIVDFLANWKESSKTEKAEQALEIVGGIASTGQSAVKTSSGVIKSIAAVSGQEAAETISALGTASSIIGIVMGTIKVAQGGFQFYQGFSANRKVKKAEEEQNKIITDINEGLQQVKTQLPDLFATGNREEILAVGKEMRVLRDTLINLQNIQLATAPAMEAIKKIGNRRMEEGAMKVAGGTLGIVSGALILSGVGAPVAMAIGALGGLLGLGYAGVKLARNVKADSLMNIAKRLSDDGQPQARPDPKPDYRIMAERVYKCYYNHLSHVLTDTKPLGMAEDDFTKVKEFVWEDKKNRVAKDEKVAVEKPSQADQLDKNTKKNKWIEVKNDRGEVLHKEKPKGTAKVHYLLSSSAHKSKQSLHSSNEELATILTLLCLQSYDSGTQQFIDSPIKPIGEADAETVAEFSNITLKTLLSAANITEKRWSKWFTKYGPDEAKLKEKVLQHIS